jgi:hypothetical protein
MREQQSCRAVRGAARLIAREIIAAGPSKAQKARVELPHGGSGWSVARE